MSGTTRSRDWRLKSTTQQTSPSSRTIGSSTASQIAPSSSSASPTSENCRPGSRGPTRADVAPRDRAPDRGGGADADRAGGVVDGVGVLRARRVGLQPALLAQRRQLGVDSWPSRWLIACSTGEACGLTDTRSSGRSAPNHSAVMIDTIDADEAWCPPTLSPPGFGRTRLAWSMIAVASHSTRSSTARSAASRSVALPRPSGDHCTIAGLPAQCPARAERPAAAGGVRVLVFAAFMIAIGYGVVAPALPVFARSFDVSVAAASAVVSAFAVARVLFAPVSGRLVGRVGELPVFCGGLSVVAASSAACAFAAD